MLQQSMWTLLNWSIIFSKLGEDLSLPSFFHPDLVIMIIQSNLDLPLMWHTHIYKFRKIDIQEDWSRQYRQLNGQASCVDLSKLFY